MPKGIYLRTEEYKKKLFQKGHTPWNKGKKMSEKYKRNVSIACRGKLKKVKVKYNAYHERVRALRGRPEKCEHCGKSGLKGWRIHWANKTGNYADPNDYLRLCFQCHWKMDKLSGGRKKPSPTS